jgi:hypothetical protein
LFPGHNIVQYFKIYLDIILCNFFYCGTLFLFYFRNEIHSKVNGATLYELYVKCIVQSQKSNRLLFPKITEFYNCMQTKKKNILHPSMLYLHHLLLSKLLAQSLYVNINYLASMQSFKNSKWCKHIGFVVVVVVQLLFIPSESSQCLFWKKCFLFTTLKKSIT